MTICGPPSNARNISGRAARSWVKVHINGAGSRRVVINRLTDPICPTVAPYSPSDRPRPPRPDSQPRLRQRRRNSVNASFSQKRSDDPGHVIGDRTIASVRGLRANIRSSHDPAGAPHLQACRTTADEGVFFKSAGYPGIENCNVFFQRNQRCDDHFEHCPRAVRQLVRRTFQIAHQSCHMCRSLTRNRESNPYTGNSLIGRS